MSVEWSFRQLRVQANLSVAALAREAGVPVGVLSDLERGKGRAAGTVLASLAEVYGVPVEHLLALCPLPAGLQEFLSRPWVSVPEGQVVRLCRLEFRGGQTLSADDWARLSEGLGADERP